MDSVIRQDQNKFQQKTIFRLIANEYISWSRQPFLGQFSPISLEELGKSAFMDRKETKYIIPGNQFNNVLNGLESDYQILEIQGRRVNHYRTLYFDTIDLYFFHQHQIGSGKRWKIRKRTYLDTQISYLEVKYKDNRKRTQKNRIRTCDWHLQIPAAERKFLSTNSPFNPGALHPSLETHYSRITMVHKNKLEKITLDSHLFFSSKESSCNLSRLVIAEVKQETLNPGSPFMAQLKKIGIRPGSFSKYCIGTALLNPTIKHNRFKPVLNKIRNLLEGESIYEWPQ